MSRASLAAEEAEDEAGRSKVEEANGGPKPGGRRQHTIGCKVCSSQTETSNICANAMPLANHHINNNTSSACLMMAVELVMECSNVG